MLAFKHAPAPQGLSFCWSAAGLGLALAPQATLRSLQPYLPDLTAEVGRQIETELGALTPPRPFSALHSSVKNSTQAPASKRRAMRRPDDARTRPST
jgi:hypothetical protein